MKRILRLTADANRQTRQKVTQIISGQNFTRYSKSQKKKATTRLIYPLHRNLKNSLMTCEKNTSSQTENSCRNLASSLLKRMHSANKLISVMKIILTAYYNYLAPPLSLQQK